MNNTAKDLLRRTLLLGAGVIAAMTASAQKEMAEPRAQALIDRLTLEEKAALMQHTSPAIPRLGIKQYNWWNEALHGVGRSGLATVFPQSIGMAASWDNDLLYEVFTAVSDEARAKSHKADADTDGKLNIYQGLTFWTPNVNIFRDPRWGRGQETYGEDPWLTSRMGLAVVRGLQGPAEAEYDKTHACAKHYAVHSGPEWNRHTYDAKEIDPRDLRETYLPAFRTLVVDGGVKEVMCAYNRYEGQPCCGNDRLLTQILRDEWGYKGLVVSDCWAINDFYNGHNTEPDATHAAATAVYNGTDLECGPNYGNLPEAVRAGLIDEAKIDRSLLRLLTARYQLGEIDRNPGVWPVPYSVVNSKPHQDLALKMAREAIVLLQNRNGILPLKKGTKIAVMGPNAADSVMQWGNYNGFPAHTSTLLSALREALPEADIIYEPGCSHTDTERLESLFGQLKADGKQGMKAVYHNNTKHEGAPAATVQLNSPFKYSTAGATTFAQGVNIKDFSAIYTAEFTPQESGLVAFEIASHGPTELLINGKQVRETKHSGTEQPYYTMTVKKGKKYDIELRFAQMFNEGTQLSFDLGKMVPVNVKEAVDRVKDADVVIFAGGISPRLEGEEMPVTIEGFKGGDRTDIELPKIQRMMVKALADAGKKIVFVNFSGSAVGLEPEAALCDGMVQAWYPGQAGGQALADVILGEYNPAGRLPVTFYRNLAQLPDFEDYSMKGRTYRYFQGDPLFRFGHGLSYTTFDYGTPSVEKVVDGLLVTVPVTNTGSRDGEEVVQVYLSKPDDKDGPSHALRAFRRVTVPAGQTINVTLPMASESLEWYDPSKELMTRIPGTYRVLIGGTSDPALLKSVEIGL